MKRSTLVSGVFTLSLLGATLVLATGSASRRAEASSSPSAAGPKRCYCCLDGAVSQVTPHACEVAHQTCHEREATAKASCRPAPPPPKK
jgi:hypothetical protein